MSNEPLLELRRELTDKEKIAWLQKNNHELKKKLDSLSNERFLLKAENKRLVQQIKDDDIKYSHISDGSKKVSAKSYNKLHRRFSEMEKRFWEVIQELNILKKEEKL